MRRRNTDEDYEEEDEYEEEEDPNEELLARYRLRAAKIEEALDECDMHSNAYDDLLEKLAKISDAIKQLEVASSQRQEKRESRLRTKYIKSDRFMQGAQILAPIVGNIVGQAVGKGIEASSRNKCTNTVVGCENEGGIVKSAAQKFIQP